MRAEHLLPGCAPGYPASWGLVESEFYALDVFAAHRSRIAVHWLLRKTLPRLTAGPNIGPFKQSHRQRRGGAVHPHPQVGVRLAWVRLVPVSVTLISCSEWRARTEKSLEEQLSSQSGAGASHRASAALRLCEMPISVQCVAHTSGTMLIWTVCNYMASRLGKPERLAGCSCCPPGAAQHRAPVPGHRLADACRTHYRASRSMTSKHQWAMTTDSLDLPYLDRVDTLQILCHIYSASSFKEKQ